MMQMMQQNQQLITMMMGKQGGKGPGKD